MSIVTLYLELSLKQTKKNYSMYTYTNATNLHFPYYSLPFKPCIFTISQYLPLLSISAL
jgi:hypothetical protein